MEQEKINNILKQDIIALKNTVFEHEQCLKNLAQAGLLTNEATREAYNYIKKETENAVNNLKHEIEEWKKIIEEIKKYEANKILESKKEDWEKAIALNEGN